MERFLFWSTIFFGIAFPNNVFSQCFANSASTLQTCLNAAPPNGYNNIQITNGFVISTSLTFQKNIQINITTNGYGVSWNPPLAAFVQNGTGGSGKIFVNGFEYDVNSNSAPNLASLNAQGYLSAFAPLPVEWLFFSAKDLNDRTVLLEWATGTEWNNEKFVVEYSTNGHTFMPIGEVTGKGTTISGKQYKFVHASPGRGSNYYRLRQINQDGTFEFSKVIQVAFSNPTGFRIFPSMVNQELNIEFPEGQQAEIHIFNQNGLRVFVAEWENPEKETIDLGHLPAGVYFTTVQSGRTHFTQRFIKI